VNKAIGGVVVFINSTDIADKKAFSKKELSISGNDKTNIHKHHSIFQSATPKDL
jgi:hypothetical protein